MSWRELNTLAHEYYQLKQSGDDEGAKLVEEEIFRKASPEIERLAKKYSAYHKNEFEDLVSEGFLGLMHALERYNPQKGRFSDFARASIEGYMKKYLERNTRLINIPATLSPHDRMVKKKMDELRRRLGREPTIEELKQEGITVEDLVKHLWMAMASSPASMDTPVGDDEDSTLYDILTVYDKEKEDIKRSLRWAEDAMLTTTEREIWELAKAGYSQTEIANKMGISQPQVSRVLRKIVSKLKKAVG